jgi:hypothetical protein
MITILIRNSRIEENEWKPQIRKRGTPGDLSMRGKKTCNNITTALMQRIPKIETQVAKERHVA